MFYMRLTDCVCIPILLSHKVFSNMPPCGHPTLPLTHQIYTEQEPERLRGDSVLVVPGECVVGPQLLDLLDKVTTFRLRLLLLVSVLA